MGKLVKAMANICFSLTAQVCRSGLHIADEQTGRKTPGISLIT